MRITKEYRRLNKQVHEEVSFGCSGYRWVRWVLGMIAQHDVKTMLDYGCGRGSLKHHLTKYIKETSGKKDKGEEFFLRQYDPCIKAWAAEPKPADLVTCTDVLEHVEPDCIDEVIDHIFSLAEKATFMSICLRPAGQHLPDGRNAHLLIMPKDWWMAKLTERLPEGWFLRSLPCKKYGKHLIVEGWKSCPVVLSK